MIEGKPVDPMKRTTEVHLSMGTKVGLISLGFMLLTNVVALVWGAARLSDAVRVNSNQISWIVSQQRQTAHILNNLTSDVRVLQDRSKRKGG